VSQAHQRLLRGASLDGQGAAMAALYINRIDAKFMPVLMRAARRCASVDCLNGSIGEGFTSMLLCD
jgi:hypothetical protein